jgi:hypothetical protein
LEDEGDEKRMKERKNIKKQLSYNALRGSTF